MSKLEYWLGPMALLAGLGTGCNDGSASADTTYPGAGETQADATELAQRMNEDLIRLRSLQVVVAGQLILEAPGEVANCYSLVCSGAEQDPVVAKEIRRQAPRLARLTELTTDVNAATESSSDELDADSVENDIAALDALAVLQIEGLAQVVPESSPSCYSLPCAADVAAANAENRRRAAVLHTVVEQALSEQL